MAKRSARPKWIKGEPKSSSDKIGEMTFKKAKARKPRANNT